MVRRRLGPAATHPYRDTALAYGVIAVLLVVIASLTGGDALRATLVAAVSFLVATVWTWWRFNGRIKGHDEAPASGGSSDGDANDNGRGSEGR